MKKKIECVHDECVCVIERERGREKEVKRECVHIVDDVLSDVCVCRVSLMFVFTSTIWCTCVPLYVCVIKCMWVCGYMCVLVCVCDKVSDGVIA